MNKVYVLGGFRTPIVVKNNKFKNVKAEELGAEVIKAILQKYPIKEDLAGIIGGNAVGTGGNITRLMSLLAGISENVPAYTVDMQCASGAVAISNAYADIAMGKGDVYICGGMESSSLQPLRVYDKKDDRYLKVKNKDGAYTTAQFIPDEMAEDAMLQGAERTMQSEKMTKEELDFWIMRSHHLAAKAQQEGLLDDIIVPINGYAMDDGIRGKISQKLLDRLPRILGENTLLTAGNSCLINDGAAFVVLVSEKWLSRHNDFKPKAEIIDSVMAGSYTKESPRGAMHTADELLKRNNMRYEDISAIEFNEAFAAIDVLFQRAHSDLIDRYNSLGVALAYGHPYGASGGILMLHLLKGLELHNGGYGVMSIAGAGGMGMGILVRGF